MQKALSVLVCVLMLLATLNTANALRCSGHLIKRDDTKADVRQWCGDPTEVRISGQEIPDSLYDPYLQEQFQYDVRTALEVWVYDFGTGYLIYEVTFSYDKVEYIRTVENTDAF